ncbi:glycosyltransferase family 2 protein [Chitinophaga sp. GCM10012297]|uniref:Glycosyltransferase family 2 protein n=1 Tax=Chitinophaga chungangae TaxID=2821488 RepID=A0ABS3YHQ6_9BACT|nr:glycosyltransferase family 2 protein [Chitinophaga chungangae]MBO9154230.1 glycosyltransferase family 2 protein [Chitinophaga chungangae]
MPPDLPLPYMSITKIILFSGLFILFFSYIGYGILLWALVKIKRLFAGPQQPAAPFIPPVALIIAAYNEAPVIREKIENTLALDYPPELLHIIFITDGSTDGTPDVVREYPAVHLMHEPFRRGKTAALNRAMEEVTAPVVIFCDANTLLNRDAIINIARHYGDPLTGGVAGEKKVIAADGNGAESTEGVYWKYESALKRLDAALYSVVGAAGELFSIRRELYSPVEPEVILDDFVISLRANMKGYRIAYEPGAYAMEAPSASIREEYKRKVRISAGGFQSIVMLSPLLNIFRYGILSFQYIGHRVLRWTLAPLSLVLALVANIVLVLQQAGGFYTLLLLLQTGFYAASALGYAMALREKKVKLLYVPFYFTFMNLAVFHGFYRYITKTQSSVWAKAARTPATRSI